MPVFGQILSTANIPQAVEITADVSNSANNIYADVTGLSFPVLANVLTRFQAYIPYTAAAVTTGSRWSMSGPVLTRGSWLVTMPPATGTAPYTPVVTNQTTYNTGVVSLGSPTVDNLLVIIEGFVQCSAAGALQISPLR